MPDVVSIHFETGVDAELYDQLDARVSPGGNPPEGLLFHSAGPTPSGGWRIVDLWDSRATFDRFLESAVIPAMAELVGEEAMKSAEPPRIESWPAHNFHK